MLIDETRATNPASKQVLAILDARGYEGPSGWVSLAEAQEAAELGTELFEPAQLDAMRDEPSRRTNSGELGEAENRGTNSHYGPLRVEVVDATTQQAAQTMCESGDVVLLNFASARNPGGGFLGGARAQEEELCRCSGLYRTLLRQPEYYTFHRAHRSLLYSDRIIYSPRVPFFRVETTAALLDAPFLPSVMTAPAPNAGAIRKNQPDEVKHLRSVFLRRWVNLLCVARAKGHRQVLLGAWGCGAFRNDARMVAQCAQEAIRAFSGTFERIVFAIPSFGPRGAENHAAFRKVLSEP